MTNKTQSLALRLADEFKLCNEYDSLPSMNDIAKAEIELRRQHDRIAELAAQLEAIETAARQKALEEAAEVCAEISKDYITERKVEGQKTGFTPDELVLNYTAWSKLVKERRTHLAPNVRQWLGQWELWDLACSPMDDNERRHIRYGHYLGWWHHEEVTPNALDNLRALARPS